MGVCYDNTIHNITVLLYHLIPDSINTAQSAIIICKIIGSYTFLHISWQHPCYHYLYCLLRSFQDSQYKDRDELYREEHQKISLADKSLHVRANTAPQLMVRFVAFISALPNDTNMDVIKKATIRPEKKNKHSTPCQGHQNDSKVIPKRH